MSEQTDQPFYFIYSFWNHPGANAVVFVVVVVVEVTLVCVDRWTYAEDTWICA